MVSSALSQMDAVPKQELSGAPQIFWAGIPGNEADFPMNDSFDTFAEQACCFLNLETNYRSSISPVGIRLGDRLSGKPVHVDISDEPMQKGIVTNRNKFILGPSGSGKSFFTNHMVRSYYEQGTHIVLVDVGHSYKGLCQMVNGYYFTYDEKNPIRFNPFYIGQGDVLDTEKKENVAVIRVEQLYPFPEKQIKQMICTYSKAKKYVWVQEEPKNQGAWSFIRDRIEGLIPENKRLHYAGRSEFPSPACGHVVTHLKEQAELVKDALS